MSVVTGALLPPVKSCSHEVVMTMYQRAVQVAARNSTGATLQGIQLRTAGRSASTTRRCGYYASAPVAS